MEFVTRHMAFAAYLLAAKQLNLIRVDASPITAVLVFDDPDHLGPELELAFLSDHALVPAAAYHAQLRALRRTIEIRMAEARTCEQGRK